MRFGDDERGPCGEDDQQCDPYGRPAPGARESPEQREEEDRPRLGRRRGTDCDRGHERAPSHDGPQRERARGECDGIVDVPDPCRDVVPDHGEHDAAAEHEPAHALVVDGRPPLQRGRLEREQHGEHRERGHGLHQHDCVAASGDPEQFGRENADRAELELGMGPVQMQATGAKQSGALIDEQPGRVVEEVPRRRVFVRHA